MLRHQVFPEEQDHLLHMSSGVANKSDGKNGVSLTTHVALGPGRNPCAKLCTAIGEATAQPGPVDLVPCGGVACS